MSERPIMEPEGSWLLKAFTSSFSSLGEPGDNWVLCAASKTQGLFSTTVPKDWPFFFVSPAIFPRQEKGADQLSVAFQSWESSLETGKAAEQRRLQQ